MAENQEIENIIKTVKNINKRIKLDFDGKIPIPV